MANGGARFTVTHPEARRLAIQPDIARIATSVAQAAAAGTPRVTGRLAGGWSTRPGRDPGTTLVVNTVPYAVPVEYGTRRRRPAAMLGRALASARGAAR